MNQNLSTSGSRSSDKPPKDSGATPKQAYAKVVTDVTILYENIGGLISLRDPLTGLIIIKSAPERSQELVNVARHHKPMMDVLKRLSTGGDYMAAIMGHVGMVMAILAVHGRVPLQYGAGQLVKLGIDPMEVAQGLAQRAQQHGATEEPVANATAYPGA